jgi:chromatin segregation and condensation protein Rec8/ScpA/Scc1 (kleisin family)
VDIVVTFLAILELVKQHLVNAYQQSIFGEIEIDVDESWNLNSTEDIELEFGE